jgi:hypothetical protein
MAKPLSELIKAVSREPVRRTLMYKGEEYEFYATYLTLAEQAKARAMQRESNDASEFALRILIDKALTSDGQKMFAPGQFAILKNEWPAAELETAMLQLVTGSSGTEEEEAVDPKPSSVTSKKTTS